MAETSGRSGLVTGGTWCADHNKLVDFWPQEDHIARILSEQWQGGGSACNLAVSLKKLDATVHVETIGLVGEDEDGRRLLAVADNHGVVRDQLRVMPDLPTSYTDAYTSASTGRRTHVYCAGTSSLLTPDHFDLHSTTSKILHLGLPGIHERMDTPWHGDANGWVTVLKRARNAGLLTNLELVSVQSDRIAALVRPCLAYLDFFIVNDVEIGAVTGIETTADGKADVKACMRAVHVIMDSGTMQLVVAHFPTGAVYLERGREARFSPSVDMPATAIAGANGAGDAFAAGVLYGALKAWPAIEAVRLGHSAAAASLRSVTTTASVVAWPECLELAETLGWRSYSL
jgi:sugar/nucleoside kinase (ribokinase family)